MGKKEVTIYTCDRCGATISDTVNSIGAWHYMHVFKWFVPTVSRYKIAYVCGECYEGFRKWYREKGDEE